MKNLMLYGLLISLFVSCSDDPEDTHCLPSDLQGSVVAFYPFTQGDLHDYSKNINILTNIGAVTTEDRQGNPGCAYSFMKTDSTYLTGNAGFTIDFHKNSFSMSVWYKPRGTRAPGDLELLITRIKNDNSKLLPYWSLSLGDCRVAEFGLVGKFLRDKKDGQLTCEEHINDLSEKWHHLVCTFDGLKMELYRNGNKSNRIQDNNPFGPAYLNNGDFFIGLNYTGVIDDIIIFNKTLTEQEVLSLYQSEPCCM